jgi:hypothetical protein
VAALLLAATAVVSQRSYVLWSRSREVQYRTHQIADFVAADIDGHDLLDGRHYQPSPHTTDGDVGDGTVLLLFTQHNCTPCDQSLVEWRRALSNHKGQIDSVAIISAAVAVGDVPLASNWAGRDSPVREMRLRNPSAFAVVSGIERLPLAMIFRDRKAVCVVDGAATLDTVTKCTAASLRAPFIAHTPIAERARWRTALKLPW